MKAVALHRLDNSAWGFGSNCFVCEADNHQGLRIPFFYDDEARMVVADYALGASFSGTPNYVHGGVTSAMLDEAMAWAAIIEVKAFAVTRSMTTRFLRPVQVGQSCRVEGRVITRREGSTVQAAAVVRSSDGDPRAEAEAEFFVMSPRQTASAIGASPEDIALQVEALCPSGGGGARSNAAEGPSRPA